MNDELIKLIIKSINEVSLEVRLLFQKFSIVFSNLMGTACEFQDVAEISFSGELILTIE